PAARRGGAARAAAPRLKPQGGGRGDGRPPAGAEQESTVTLPTIRLVVPVPEAPGTSAAKPPAPETPHRPTDLVQSIERIRQADERFQLVHAEVIDGAVFLRGSVQSGEDQFELAQRISRLPGVTRVVLAEVRVRP